MNNKSYKLEVEILNHYAIGYYKKYLKQNSLSFYEDFLLEYVVFIKVNNDFKEELLNNPNLKIHTGNFAYQVNVN